jgi:hypothetical protein
MLIVTCAGVKVPAIGEKGSLKFSSTMSDGDFFKWLRSKGISEKDCNTLSGTYTNTINFFYVSYYSNRKNVRSFQ